MIALRAGGATDVGLVRSNNQDQLLAADPLYAVADGMGGAAAGEVASATACRALDQVFHSAPGPTPDLLIRAARAANRAVWEKAEAHAEMRGMGTTLVALALVEGGQIAIANVGDSRLYHMHDGELRQVTADHNLVAEMVAQGRISQEEAEVHPRRNIMTRALGVEPEVPIDLFVEEARVGDRYLLCSDGLPREVKDELIASLLRRFADPEEAAHELVEEAKRRGGNDNITVVVVDVVDSPTPAADDSTARAAADRAEDATTALPAADGAGDASRVGATDGVGVGGAQLAASAPAAADPDAKGGGADPTTPAPTGKSRGRRSFFRLPRRGRNRRAHQARPTARMITPRVIGFVALLLVVLGGAAAGVAWYARSSYFVGLRGNQLVIFKGRPGGVLWFKPTVAQRTGHTTFEILPADLAKVQSGTEEPSLAAAQSLVTRLVQAKAATSTTTLPPATTTIPVPTTRASPPTTASRAG